MVSSTSPALPRILAAGFFSQFPKPQLHAQSFYVHPSLVHFLSFPNSHGEDENPPGGKARLKGLVTALVRPLRLSPASPLSSPVAAAAHLALELDIRDEGEARIAADLWELPR